MNPQNYASLEASKRLIEAGIVLETDFYWVYCKKSKAAVPILVSWNDPSWLRKSAHFRKSYPALSMGEAFMELPCEAVVYKGAEEYFAYLLTSQREVTFNNTNPIDALIDLLIWVRSENPPVERRE